jgi:hypothetical protein
LYSSLLEAVAKYESELYEELADAAENAADAIAEEVAAGTESATSAMWFGFESRQILIWRLEGLLKTMELLAAATVSWGGNREPASNSSCCSHGDARRHCRAVDLPQQGLTG